MIEFLIMQCDLFYSLSFAYLYFIYFNFNITSFQSLFLTNPINTYLLTFIYAEF